MAEPKRNPTQAHDAMPLALICAARGGRPTRDGQPARTYTEYYVEFGSYSGEEPHPIGVRPLVSFAGTKLDPPKPSGRVSDYRMEVMRAGDVPPRLGYLMFDASPFDLLERLSVGEVLALRLMGTGDGGFPAGGGPRDYDDLCADGLADEVEGLLGTGVDDLDRQPRLSPITDEIYYQYDFGDDWVVRVTGGYDCRDLVEAGAISQAMLDRSNLKARVTYRPVLISRDGDMLFDDVGEPAATSASSTPSTRWDAGSATTGSA